MQAETSLLDFGRVRILLPKTTCRTIEHSDLVIPKHVLPKLFRRTFGFSERDASDCKNACLAIQREACLSEAFWKATYRFTKNSLPNYRPLRFGHPQARPAKTV
jgi:hypothetical protein